MATANLPLSTFRMAVVRAPRKPLVEEGPARRIEYPHDSALYNALKAARNGPDPRQGMGTAAQAFVDSDPLAIHDLITLKGLFNGFDRVDDLLRTEQKGVALTELKALVEGPDVLDESASDYVNGAGYSALSSRVWDNVFALTILGVRTALRTEMVKVLRLLNVIEKIAAEDDLLDTGAGIFSAYMSVVLLPASLFPIPDLALPEEPVTRPPADDPSAAWKTQLNALRSAYDEVRSAYDRQMYLYKDLSYPERDEEDPDDGLQRNVIDHHPLELIDPTERGLSNATKAELDKLGIDTRFIYMPYVHERFTAEIRKLGRLIHAHAERATVVRLGGALIMLGNECVNPTLESPCAPFVFSDWPGGAGHVRPVGIADLKVVRTQLYKYELGEVAHVENVLKGEVRKRTFRDLKRQESTLEEERETTQENVRETQTTERFELQQESNNVVQQDQSQQAGVTISGGYGPVWGSAYYDTASGMSQAEASSQATSYAKEVMERALQRVIERTRTKRTVTTIIETEDTTEHSFKNDVDGGGGTDNVAGVYRWLDKLYYNQVVNYGRRMMFEFIIPEPAAFHIFSKLAKPIGNDTMEAPPPFDIGSFEDIREDTYEELAVRFGATNIKPPPSAIQSVQATTSKDPTGQNDEEWNTWVTQVTVPSGFMPTSVRVSLLMSGGSGRYITLSIGTCPLITRHHSAVIDITDIPAVTGGDIPVVMRARSTHHAVGVQVFCQPTAETIQQWKIETYAALKAAHEQKVSEYNRWLNQQSVNSLVQGANPAINRQVERQELKKHCIAYITGQRFESFDALRTNVAPFGYPEFSFDEATKEGKYIQFFEQAFEWEQMTYLFYPYYWARKKEWVNILQRDENDPLFMKFLQAGAARVLVPVRPGYNKAILHYLNTGGEIWNGEDVPTPDDPMYVSIIDEIMEADGNFQGGEVEGEPWLSKVPTSLVYLTHQETPNDLPDFSGDLPL